jgi:hypothetical protein
MARRGADRRNRIRRRDFYVKYGMFPHPGGKFYDIGLGHLLKRLGDGVDTMLNQLIDAGTAQTAGGGFIGSGVRLQSRGARGVVRFSARRIQDRRCQRRCAQERDRREDLADVSPVTFQLLELILGAAKDIAGIKDVMTGEASNQGPGRDDSRVDRAGPSGLQCHGQARLPLAQERLRAAVRQHRRVRGRGCGQGLCRGSRRSRGGFRQGLRPQRAGYSPGQRSVFDHPDAEDGQGAVQLGLLPQIQATGGDPKEVMMRVLEAVDTEDIDKISRRSRRPIRCRRGDADGEHEAGATQDGGRCRQIGGRSGRASARRSRMRPTQHSRASSSLGLRPGCTAWSLALAAHMESPAMSFWSWFNDAFDVGAADASAHRPWPLRSCPGRFPPHLATSSRHGATIRQPVRDAALATTPTNAATNGSGCRGKAGRPINASSTACASARTHCSASRPITKLSAKHSALSRNKRNKQHEYEWTDAPGVFRHRRA